jgi:phosphatidylserine decarboxylase
MKFAPEGYSYIIVFTAVTAAVFLLFGIWIAFLPFVLTLFMFFFFRDPERKTPEDKNIFISPADGKIIVIKDTFENEYLKTDAKMISIFMSPLNVHVNRIPCDSVVKDVFHKKGKFLAAYKENASIENESISLVLDTKYGGILVRQVAGYIARRAVCRVKAGDALKQGERYGIIKFSSRLDVYLPKNSKINIKIGEKVKAGETILSHI